MPIYSPDERALVDFINTVMREHHPHLSECELTIDVLEARPKTDESGDPTEEALKHAGYPCLATIKKRGPKDRGAGLGDVLLTVDAYRWDELDPGEQTALIDHELTHVELIVNDSGVVKRDDYDRPKVRMRLHDHQFGWFDSVAQRHPISSQEVQQARRFVDDFGQTYLPGFTPPKRSRSRA